MSRKVERKFNSNVITKAIEVNTVDLCGQLHKEMELFANKST
jgi:hypothetical protein